jgi:hypothetical protein
MVDETQREPRRRSRRPAVVEVQPQPDAGKGGGVAARFDRAQVLRRPGRLRVERQQGKCGGRPQCCLHASFSLHDISLSARHRVPT